MSSNHILLAVFVIAHILFFIHIWKNAADYQGINDPDREVDFINFYHP